MLHIRSLGCKLVDPLPLYWDHVKKIKNKEIISSEIEVKSI